MYVCPNCNYQSETPMHFCFNCGAKTVFIENQQPQQQYQQYPPYQQQYQPYQQQYQQPHYYEPPRPSNLGKKIPSIILGAIGFVFAIFNILYALIFLGVDEPEAAFACAIMLSIFSFPLCIVGKVLSSKCKDGGDDSASAGIGGGFGVAGIIISAIALFLTFIGMA